MAWLEQWSYAVDGEEFNEPDRTTGRWMTYIPELDNGLEGEQIWVPVEGDIPWYVRTQPQAGRFTILTQMHACTPAQYAARLAIWRGIFEVPGLHELVAQARGQSGTRTIPIYTNGGWMAEYTLRRLSTVVTVPEQVW